MRDGVVVGREAVLRCQRRGELARKRLIVGLVLHHDHEHMRRRGRHVLAHICRARGACESEQGGKRDRSHPWPPRQQPDRILTSSLRMRCSAKIASYVKSEMIE